MEENENKVIENKDAVKNKIEEEPIEKEKVFTRNKFLHPSINILNPAIINETITLAMKNAKSIWPIDNNLPGYFLIKPLEPMCFGMQFSKRRARLAYGLQGLPQIIHQIGSCRICTINKALLVLIDLLYDQYEYSRAVNDYRIVKRLEDALFKRLPETLKEAPTLKLIMRNYELVSAQYVGAVAMMKQYNLIDTFYELILCDSRTNEMCAKILANLSSYQLIAEEMVYLNHLGKLKRIFDKTKRALHMIDLYVHLSHLITLNPEQAIDDGYFKYLITKLTLKSPAQTMIIKCSALLLNCQEAHKRMDNYDGVKILYELLGSEKLPNDTLQYVAMALQNCTFSRKSIWRCREFWDLPTILLRHAYNQTNDNLQIYSLQLLRQITGMPSVKNYVRRTCKRKIIDLVCRTEKASKLKCDLLEWLRKKPYINVDNNNDVKFQNESECNE